MTQHQNAPKWLNARLELAQALASGKYVQQPPSQQKTSLRDTQGRYTIDGVAADLSPIIWTLIEGRWRAVWIDELSGTSALEKAKNGAITGLTPDEEAQLIHQGAGEETSFPEVTACYLGLHDSNGHAAILMIHPDAVPTGLAKELGLPMRTSPYPAEDLSFHQAATLITLHPLCLGPGNAPSDDDCV